MRNIAINQHFIVPNSFFDKKKFLSPNFLAFLFAVAIHSSLLLFVFFQNNNSNQPILSFTVTMLDVSASSSNFVASDASAASNYKSAASNKIEENKNALGVLAKNNQESLKQDSKSDKKTLQANNSSQQTAVISPTKQAIFDAAYLRNEAPIYPPLSRHLEEQGTVLLNVFVDVDGKAQDVIIKKSSGFSRLDKEALKTVKKWNFIPAKQGDKMTASWVQVPVDFVLEN